VCIATRYGLDGPGSNPGGGEIFCTPPDRPSYTMCTGCFVGVKRPRRGVDHPSPSSTEIKLSVDSELPLLHVWDFVVCCRVYTHACAMSLDVSLVIILQQNLQPAYLRAEHDTMEIPLWHKSHHLNKSRTVVSRGDNFFTLN